jgi:hypothetical protein
MTDQAIASITYPRIKESATEATVLPMQYLVSFAGNVAKTEWYATLDPTAIAQVTTITFTAGTTGDDYAVTVTANSVAYTYRHKQEASQNATAIAAFMAAIMDTHPGVSVTATGAVVTVTSSVPGQAVTFDKTQSTTASNVVIATTTANAGTPLQRKIGEASVTFAITDVNSNGIGGFPEISLSGKWYDGALSPTVTQNFGPLKSTAPKSANALQISAGIPQP